MNSIIYDMHEFDKKENLLTDALLILAIDREARSQYALREFNACEQVCQNAIIFDYDNYASNIIDTASSIPANAQSKIVLKGLPKSQTEFVSILKKCDKLRKAKRIVIDISSILTPYLFLLLKCIYMWNKNAHIYAINTVPFDYTFPQFPFLSYKSYYGNLKMEEVIGFSSMSGIQKVSDLFIFAGFEGALTLKVVEDIEYQHLYFVNALPSYYQKYKDISIISNHKLITSKESKMLYTPAINPFEVYNLLDKHIDDGQQGVSIAPLCTKPVSLGICMYALQHNNVRIVFPFSDKYNTDRSHDVYKTYVYKLCL